MIWRRMYSKIQRGQAEIQSHFGVLQNCMNTLTKTDSAINATLQNIQEKIAPRLRRHTNGLWLLENFGCIPIGALAWDNIPSYLFFFLFIAFGQKFSAIYYVSNKKSLSSWGTSSSLVATINRRGQTSAAPD